MHAENAVMNFYKFLNNMLLIWYFIFFVIQKRLLGFFNNTFKYLTISFTSSKKMTRSDIKISFRRLLWKKGILCLFKFCLLVIDSHCFSPSFWYHTTEHTKYKTRISVMNLRLGCRCWRRTMCFPGFPLLWIHFYHHMMRKKRLCLANSISHVQRQRS